MNGREHPGRLVRLLFCVYLAAWAGLFALIVYRALAPVVHALTAAS